MSSKIKFFSPLSPKLTKKTCFRESFDFFSKRSSVQVEWNAPLTNLPKLSSKSPTHFCLSRNVVKKLFHFSADKQFFIKRCLYRWNTFLTTVPKKLSYTRKKFILKHRSWSEKMKLLEKVSKLCSTNTNRSHVNSAEPKLSVVRIISSPSPKGYEILFFW